MSGSDHNDGRELAGEDDSAATEQGLWLQARSRWWRWRHTRPFWGALLVVLGAAEILLSERAPLPLVIHIGLQGLAGYLVPLILLVAGVLLLINPVQRVFYAVLAIILALLSWITSNLGGFFIGMVLGVIGGALALAWTTSGRPRSPRWRRKRPSGGEPSAGLDLILGDTDDADEAPGTWNGQREPTQQAGTRSELSESRGPHAAPQAVQARLPGSIPRQSSWAARVLPASPLAVAIVGAVVYHAGLPGQQLSLANDVNLAAVASSSPSRSISPSASPTTSARPTPTASASPTPTVSGSSPPIGTAPPPLLPPPRPPRGRTHVPRATLRGPGPAAVPSTLTAGSAAVTGLSFDGVARVQTAAGTVLMLKFSLASMVLSGGTGLTFTRAGRAIVTSAQSLRFSGHITLFTTKISGELSGRPVVYTPKHPPVNLSPDLTLANVVASQPFAFADVFTGAGLVITEPAQ